MKPQRTRNSTISGRMANHMISGQRQPVEQSAARTLMDSLRGGKKPPKKSPRRIMI